MKKTGYWKGFASALVLVGLVAALGVTAAAAHQRTIQVEEGVAISINGARFIPRDEDGKKLPVFRYNGTAYAPVQALGEAAGMEAAYDAAAGTVELTTAERAVSRHPDAGDYITSSKAKTIALRDAGVREEDAVFLKAHLDWDDGRAEYEVEFYSGNVEYDYDIDAVTGAILSSDRELEDFDLRDGASSDSGDYITARRAKAIALDRAPAGAVVVKCELDRDDGRAVYELELRSGRTEYECDIDAVSGEILSWETDHDD